MNHFRFTMRDGKVIELDFASSRYTSRTACDQAIDQGMQLAEVIKVEYRGPRGYSDVTSVWRHAVDLGLNLIGPGL